MSRKTEPPPRPERAMPESLTCRMARPADLEPAAGLVRSAFDEFIAPDYEEQGVAEFHRYAEPEAFRARMEGGSHFVMVAEVDGRLAAVAEIRDCNHVALLFVGKQFHRRGIARALFDRALQQARAARPGVERVTMNSSRYGVAAYERLGFRQTGPERSVNGIVFVPMAMRLDFQSPATALT